MKRILLGLMLTFIVGVSIWIQIVIPEMRGDFYNALIERSSEYVHFFAVFLGSLLFYYIMDSIRPLILSLLGLDIRKYLLKRILRKPVCLEDNADGRLSSDIKNFVETSLSLLLDIVIAFFAILGLVSQVPEQLIIYTVGYTVAVTILAICFNRPLTKAAYNIQSSEQTFRMDIRGHVYNSEDLDVDNVFKPVYNTNYKNAVVLTWFRSFASIKMLLGIIIPFAVLIPVYMSGAIDFKILIQGVTTFDLLVSNTTILVNLYPVITSALASFKRIKELVK
jgi:ABC-type uncharacterized transport system fused permease/ATPase subunit